jgi:hypothetical protein
MTQVSEQLIDDHAALDEILKQLQTALLSSNIEVAHAMLDLSWARLAVHIRAEHLQLFPIMPEEAQGIVAELRKDHNFFMDQLALAVEIMRELVTLPDQLIVPEGLDNVKKIVLEVEQRLVKHNQLEESTDYRSVSISLNPQEQAELASRITTELRNHPPRFTLSTWLNE